MDEVLVIFMVGAPVRAGEDMTSSDDSHDFLIQSVLCRRRDASLWQARSMLVIDRLLLCWG
jgi:hypothetical protein